MRVLIALIVLAVVAFFGYRMYQNQGTQQAVEQAAQTASQAATQAADAAKQAALKTQIAVAENNMAAQAELKPTPTNVTLTDRMTLYRGSREIQIRFLGRGHTGGDVVVFLPREKVVMTGDFLTAGLSNMSDAYLDEWVTSLDALKMLDFDTVLPGHGVPFKGKERITAFQEYLRDLIAQTATLKRQGLSAEDAAARIDLTKHAAMFPQIRAVGVDAAVTRRIYRLAQEPNAGPTP